MGSKRQESGWGRWSLRKRVYRDIMTVDRLGQGLLGDKRWVASGRERAYPLTGP